MDKTDPRYALLLDSLVQELVPAMGCTEPISIAYAAAIVRDTLGMIPESAHVEVSGNIIKNAMAVTVPNSGGRKGIETAVSLGLVAGQADRKLQVIAEVTPQQLAEADRYRERGCITVSLMEDAHLFDIRITVEAGEHTASIQIMDRHTNIVSLTKDGQTVLDLQASDSGPDAMTGKPSFDIDSIYEFACTCVLEDVIPVIERQISFNTAISEEGLSGRWGAAVGRTILNAYGSSDVRIRARAAAAAGSDARMSGCEMPVVINSGSGNQGMTVSLPVIEYAKELGSTSEELTRALVLANLVAIHEKSCIGCLSAYCGAISAGSAAGAGIAFLHGGDLWMINHTIVNSLAILSGTICDGAKPSCAAKIAAAVDAGILGYEMSLHHKQFVGGEGIIKKGVENTIQSVGRLAREGMKETDREILNIMIDKQT